MAEISKRHSDDTMVIVSHGIALAVIICRTEGLTIEAVYDHLPENAMPYRVRWE